MTHLFYIWVAYWLFLETVTVLNVKKIYESLEAYGDKKKGFLTIKPSLKDSHLIIGGLCVPLPFIGLLSSQWVLFAAILLLSVLRALLVKIPKIKTGVRIVDGVVSIGLIAFILINKYHLHINLFDLFK